MKETITRSVLHSMIGMCSKCKEHTPVDEPCCNASVFFEGSFYTLDDFEIVEDSNERIL